MEIRNPVTSFKVRPEESGFILAGARDGVGGDVEAVFVAAAPAAAAAAASATTAASSSTSTSAFFEGEVDVDGVRGNGAGTGENCGH